MGVYTLGFDFTFLEPMDEFISSGKLDNFVNKLATILAMD